MIPNINLLPQLDKKSQSSKLLYIIMGVVVLLALILFAFMFFSSKMKINDLLAEQQALMTEQATVQAQIDSLQNMNTGSVEESLAFVERVSYPVSPIIDEAQNLLTANTYLRNYAFSAESIQITADFEMLSDVSKYVDALLASAYFSDVQVESVSNFEVAPVGDEEELSVEQQDKQKMQEVPRYNVSITLSIDDLYLATGGTN